MTLCLEEADFKAALRHLKTGSEQRWVRAGSGATTHFYENDRGNTVAVVCIDDWRTRKPVEVAGLLVHEAVHVWQNYAQDIGETRPGDEQEAYAIQSIAQELMAEFARRMKA